MTNASIIWWPTSVAASKLGISKQALKAFVDQNLLKEGIHFRRDGWQKGYLFDMDAVKKTLAVREPM